MAPQMFSGYMKLCLYTLSREFLAIENVLIDFKHLRRYEYQLDQSSVINTMGDCFREGILINSRTHIVQVDSFCGSSPPSTLKRQDVFQPTLAQDEHKTKHLLSTGHKATPSREKQARPLSV